MNPQDANTIKKACGYDFAGWLLSNGHFHTMKAYGEFIVWNGSEKEGVFNQVDYLLYTMKKENMDINEILFAETVEDAMEREILDEDRLYF